jgi:hypothetical protein
MEKSNSVSDRGNEKEHVRAKLLHINCAEVRIVTLLRLKKQRREEKHGRRLEKREIARAVAGDGDHKALV